MKKNRIAALLLSLSLLGTAVLTGCSSQNNSAASQPSTSTPEQKEDTNDQLAQIQEKDRKSVV